MDVKLYMLLLGCKPHGRHTEQHDVFFGIGASLSALVPAIADFWPEAAGKIHIDAWREVTRVDGFSIRVLPRSANLSVHGSSRLFFINLGGYKPHDFEEYHYRCLSVAPDVADAIRQAKAETFWKHSVSSHIDDKYGVDVDDAYEIEDLLASDVKARYALVIDPCTGTDEDGLHSGYLKLDKLIGR